MPLGAFGRRWSEQIRRRMRRATHPRAFAGLLPAPQPLEPLPRLGVDAIGERRWLPLRVLRPLEIAEERPRADLHHLLPGRTANRRVRGDEADAIGRPVLRREPLEQCVRVRRVADVERPVVLVGARPVKDEDATGALDRDEAGERVAQLAQIREPARVQQVVAVEQVQGRVRRRAASAPRRAAARPRRSRSATPHGPRAGSRSRRRRSAARAGGARAPRRRARSPPHR
jgi:hypothetical protein